jgi:hypothetical protein
MSAIITVAALIAALKMAALLVRLVNAVHINL